MHACMQCLNRSMKIDFSVVVSNLQTIQNYFLMAKTQTNQARARTLFCCRSYSFPYIASYSVLLPNVLSHEVLITGQIFLGRLQLGNF